MWTPEADDSSIDLLAAAVDLAPGFQRSVFFLQFQTQTGFAGPAM
jgi:hypothetical protein